MKTPFIHRVPKDLRANLRWRADVHRRALDSPAFASAIKDACMNDPLFFLSGFGFTYDPRSKPFPKLPFILYPFQEESTLEILTAIEGGYDLLIEKSRDMGASWMCVAAIEWLWLFRSMRSFLFVSRKEEYVDCSGNPKALFWKFDFLLDNLPEWLKPVGYNSSFRKSLHIENPENGSVVDGESTTGSVARGDRRTAVLLDEFAAVREGYSVLSSTRDATNCRLFNSTPEGVNNAFYDMRQSQIRKLRLHWSQHPVKTKGLYSTHEDGTLKVLDAKGYPCGYTPILDGKLRSPWYDNECTRVATAQEIAQELDIDYLGSGFQYFKADAVHETIRKYARPPAVIGDLEYDTTTAEPICFREDDTNGRLRLWCFLGKDMKPALEHKYAIGNDVSAGTGASNSCSSVWDTTTGEKVAEYVNPYIRPEAFAKQAVALARWFGGAYLIWESNGPGRQFGSRVIELGYMNVYYRKREEALSKKITDVPGWAATKETKLVMMGSYRSAVERQECINRSKEALEETLEYVFTVDGGIAHSGSTNRDDPSGAKANHGDRVVADALGWKGISERKPKPAPKVRELPAGCLAWRNARRKKAQKEDAGWR